MPKKIPKKGTPEAHDELKGFDIQINEFGEIVSTIAVDRLNTFLNKNVQDKKLSEDVLSTLDKEEEE